MSEAQFALNQLLLMKLTVLHVQVYRRRMDEEIEAGQQPQRSAWRKT